MKNSRSLQKESSRPRAPTKHAECNFFKRGEALKEPRAEERPMKIGIVSLLGTGLCAVTLSLSGCGAPQSPIGNAGLQRPTIKQATSSAGALMYVMVGDSAYVLTYPGLARIKRFAEWGYSTSNPNNGELLIGGRESPLNLYAHSSAKPLHSFEFSDELSPFDGALDPTSDAVAITVNGTTGGNHVYVYPTPTSTPIQYTVPGIRYLEFIAYDAQGNLFVDGLGTQSVYPLAELPKSGNTFEDLTVNGTLNGLNSIQWDGAYLAVFGDSAIYRLQVSGTTATVVGQTKLTGAWNAFGEFWIQGNTVIGPHASDAPHDGRWVGFWHYPAGGQAYIVLKTLSKNQKDRMSSATVSVAPSP
jgi:hypothetical protein